MALMTDGPGNAIRFPRLQIISEVQGRSIPLDIQLTVLDMSVDGFAVQSPIEFSPHVEYQFQFSDLDAPHPVIRAVGVHCLRVVADAKPWYIAGFYFVPATASAERARILRMAVPRPPIPAVSPEKIYRDAPQRLL